MGLFVIGTRLFGPVLRHSVNLPSMDWYCQNGPPKQFGDRLATQLRRCIGHAISRKRSPNCTTLHRRSGQRCFCLRNPQNMFFKNNMRFQKVPSLINLYRTNSSGSHGLLLGSQRQRTSTQNPLAAPQQLLPSKGAARFVHHFRDLSARLVRSIPVLELL